MEQVTCYRCSVCGKLFQYENMAEKCEKGHRKPPENVRVYRWSAGDKYPSEIIVRMDGGDEVRYTLDRTVGYARASIMPC